MTTHYLDIRLLPDPEFSPGLLLSALYAKLHRALVQLAADDIGVSFPQYALNPRKLGDVLRLHGTETALQRLQSSDWLQGMRDHTQVSEIATVPSGAQHRCLLRRQFKTNADRLRRRRMKRKTETLEQACQAIPDSVERRPDLPYLSLRSQSTGQRFCLFLELSEPQTDVVAGSFNSYGLSATATVPWF